MRSNANLTTCRKLSATQVAHAPATLASWVGKIYDWAEVQASSTRATASWRLRSTSGSHLRPGSRRSSGRSSSVGDRPFEDRRRRYDWAVVQAYYDEGHSIRDCAARLRVLPRRLDEGGRSRRNSSTTGCDADRSRDVVRLVAPLQESPLVRDGILGESLRAQCGTPVVARQTYLDARSTTSMA